MTMKQKAPDAVKVLCVDDEEYILNSLKRLFIDEEFEVITALSGQAGLALLADTNNVGVIISDQRMPGMLGAEFLHACRTVAPDAARILLTGYSDLTSTIDAINNGGLSRYLGKPWNDEELLMVVRDALQQYTLIIENRRLNGVVQQQNEELQEWNKNLKGRVLAQTITLRQKNEELYLTLQRIKQSYESMIVALAGLVKLREQSLFQHACNVADLSRSVAIKAGITPYGVENIRVAALLHDLGKLGIPERILHLTPEQLNPEELRVYQTHAIRGQMALHMIEELRPAGILIRHHHEHFDGSGFPDRLSGSDIPLGARIIAFADFIDNTFTGQTATTLELALDQAEELGGSRLDPQLQRLFERVAANLYGLETDRFTGTVTEREISPFELQSGMTLSRHIYTGSGVLLLRQGTVLDDFKREAIQRFYTFDPTNQGVFVMLR